MKLLSTLGLAAFVLLTATVNVASAQWQFVDLDALPYPWCTPCQWTEGVDIADDGSVLIQLGPGGTWPVISKDNSLTPIVITNGSQSGGTGIAYNGRIVIGMTALAGSSSGFRWESGTTSFLNWRPYGLNRQGDIAGDIYVPNATAAVNGQSIGVSLGGVNSSARAINDYGVVVGNAQLPNGRDHAFMWQSGTVTDLGTLGGGYSQCVSVNSHGAVTGRSELALGGSHAYIWQNGVMQDLGAFGSDSDAFDVNDDNVVVGTSGYRAFIWRGGAMEDLNSLVNLPSGWVLVQARAVNNSGAIVGWGEHQFKKKAFLLLPYGPVPTKTSTWGELKARYR